MSVPVPQLFDSKFVHEVSKIPEIEVNSKYQYEDADILGILRINLRTINNPTHFMPEYTVGNSATSLSMYLSDEKKIHNGTRKLFIPYNVSGFHWLALVITFNNANNITEILCIDSLINKERNEWIQVEVARCSVVYPELGNLQIKVVEGLIQSDDVSCGPLTIENLLTIATDQKLVSKIISTKTLEKIRQDHVQRYSVHCLDFNRRQRENINRVASFAQQYKWLNNPHSPYNIHEQGRIIQCIQSIGQISTEEMRKNLIDAFNSQKNGEEHHIYLTRIRNVLVELKNKLAEKDRVALTGLLNALFGLDAKVAMDFSTLGDCNFKLPFHAIIAIGQQNNSSAKQLEELQANIKKQIEQDHDLAIKLQRELRNNNSNTNPNDKNNPSSSTSASSVDPSFSQGNSSSSTNFNLRSRLLSSSSGGFSSNTGNLSYPLIFSSAEISNQRLSEGLFDHLAEIKQSKEVDEHAKSTVLKYLTQVQCELGRAVGQGDCFFDAVAQGLVKNNIMIPREYLCDFGYKKLRSMCEKYAKNALKDKDHWLQTQLKNENVNHNDYLIGVGYTAPEVENMHKESLLPVSTAIWGRSEIDGRIICEILNIKLHVLKIHVLEGNIVLIHQLIDANGSKKIVSPEEINKLYTDSKIVHLAGYQNSLYFVPVFQENEKNLDDLLVELRKSNQSNANFLQDLDNIAVQVIQVNKAYIKPSTLHTSSGAALVSFNRIEIGKWEKAHIQRWTEAFKKEKIVINDNTLPEVLAVVKRAVQLGQGVVPRNVQLLSVVSLLRKDNKCGRLAQIFTGEGKSMIISMLAIVQALQGRMVDIVTSSEVLARRDAKEKNEFYSFFGFTSRDNCENNISKECYQSAIVYGDTLNFQADILYDEYKQWGTRNKRRFDVVIVDEVDNMLIDERLRMTLLSTPTPGMSSLTPVLGAIWNIVNKISHVIMNPGILSYEKNLDPAVLVKLHLKEDMEKIKTFAEAQIPKYLKEYAIKNIFVWCCSATKALMLLNENEHYVVRGDQIVPVDYQSTGVLQMSMHWSDGLHQFLQMKHDLRVTQINLTTNFLSNVSYFQRYQGNIFGLTGTLGSQAEQKLLTELYSLDTVYIPSYRTRKLEEIPGCIVRGQKAWVQAVKSNVLQNTASGRAVLVICETIRKVKAIECALQQDKYDPMLIRCYIEGNEAEQSITKAGLVPGQVILATNLAGRGTDIKISNTVQENGGLHVCLTFLPENLRVEEQAFGRAGRQGNPGTAQLVIDIGSEHSNGPYSQCNLMHDIKNIRNQKEGRFLQIAMEETRKVVNKDRLFQKFCVLMREMTESSGNNKAILNALEERWALWLLTLSNQDLLTEIHQTLFEKFQDEIRKDAIKNDIIQNPKYYLKQGNELFDKKQYQEALEAYKKASSMNESDWYPIYYQAITKIKLQEQKKYDPKSAKEIAEQLKETQSLCADDIVSYQSLKVPSLQRSIIMDTEGKKQREIAAVFKQELQEIEAPAKINSCTRYDKLIEAKWEIFERIRKLADAAELACQQGKMCEIEIIEIDIKIDNIMRDLRNDGLTFIASTEKPLPKLAIAITGILGILELAAGITLCATGIGAIWGYGFIIEGVSDLITTGITYKNREFNWKIYIATKSVSLSLTAAGCGALNLVSGTAPAALKIIIGVAEPTIRIGREIVRAHATRKAEEKEAQEKLERLIEESKLGEKVDKIQKMMDIVSSKNPAYIEEFEYFKQNCTKTFEEILQSLLKDTFQYLVYFPSFEKMVLDACNIANKASEDILNSAFKNFSQGDITPQLVIKGIGSKAFELLKQTKVFEQFSNNLLQSLKELDCYSSERLVYKIAELILNESRGKIDAESKNIGDLKATIEALQVEKKRLLADKSKTQDKQVVQFLKGKLCDVQEKIDQINELHEKTISYNNQVKLIKSMDRDIICKVIQFLNNKVFKEGTVFEMLELNEKSIKEFFESIPMDGLLKPLFVEVLECIYKNSANRAKNIARCVELIALDSQSGPESLVHLAFGKYINKLSEIHNLDIQNDVALVKTVFRKEMAKQQSDMIGRKIGVLEDNNSLFSSVAVSIGLPPERHANLMTIAVSYIEQNKKEYEELMQGVDLKKFCEEYSAMDASSRSNSNRNEIMIDALAKALQVHIVLHDECPPIGIRNINQNADIQIHLSYRSPYYTPYQTDDLSSLKSIRDRLAILLSSAPSSNQRGPILFSGISTSSSSSQSNFSSIPGDGAGRMQEEQNRNNKASNSSSSSSSSMGSTSIPVVLEGANNNVHTPPNDRKDDKKNTR